MKKLEWTRHVPEKPGAYWTFNYKKGTAEYSVPPVLIKVFHEEGNPEKQLIVQAGFFGDLYPLDFIKEKMKEHGYWFYGPIEAPDHKGLA